MDPRQRFDFSPIVNRPPLKMPNGARVAVYTVVNVEDWDFNKPAPLAHAVKVGNLVFVSGLPPYYGDKPRQFVPDDFAAQFHQCMSNLKTVLADAGSSLEKVVKMNIIVTRQSDFFQMNDLYRPYFAEGNHPARTTVVCGLGIPGVLLEIECVAEC